MSSESLKRPASSAQDASSSVASAAKRAAPASARHSSTATTRAARPASLLPPLSTFLAPYYLSLLPSSPLYYRSYGLHRADVSHVTVSPYFAATPQRLAWDHVKPRVVAALLAAAARASNAISATSNVKGISARYAAALAAVNALTPPAFAAVAGAGADSSAATAASVGHPLVLSASKDGVVKLWYLRYRSTGGADSAEDGQGGDSDDEDVVAVDSSTVGSNALSISPSSTTNTASSANAAAKPAADADAGAEGDSELSRPVPLTLPRVRARFASTAPSLQQTRSFTAHSGPVLALAVSAAAAAPAAFSLGTDGELCWYDLALGDIAGAVTVASAPAASAGAGAGAALVAPVTAACFVGEAGMNTDAEAVSYALSLLSPAAAAAAVAAGASAGASTALVAVARDILLGETVIVPIAAVASNVSTNANSVNGDFESDATATSARSGASSGFVTLPPGQGYVFVYSRSSATPIAIARPHQHSIVAMAQHPTLPYAVSVDCRGCIEYWSTRGGLLQTVLDRHALANPLNSSSSASGLVGSENSASGNAGVLPWSGSALTASFFRRPPAPLVSFELKSATDLYCLQSTRAAPALSLAFAPTGQLLALATKDGAVRVFDARKGKLVRQWSEGAEAEVKALQALIASANQTPGAKTIVGSGSQVTVGSADGGQMTVAASGLLTVSTPVDNSLLLTTSASAGAHGGRPPAPDSIVIAQKLSLEKELDRALAVATARPSASTASATAHVAAAAATQSVAVALAAPATSSLLSFDGSGYYLTYATLAGIKTRSIVTGAVVRLLGTAEAGDRFLSLAFYHGGRVGGAGAARSIAGAAAASAAAAAAATAGGAAGTVRGGGGASVEAVMTTTAAVGVDIVVPSIKREVKGESAGNDFSAPLQPSSTSSLTSSGSSSSSGSSVSVPVVSGTVDFSEEPVLLAVAFRKPKVYLFACSAPGAVGSRDSHDAPLLSSAAATAGAGAAGPAGAAAAGGGKAKNTGADAQAAEAAAALTAAGEVTRVTLHTTAGDIMMELLHDVAPKAALNFATHCRKGYYDKTIFHRLSDEYGIMGGDPNGDGSGGSSIWGRPFANETHPSVKHNAPGTVSMTNRGTGANESQFFITTAAVPRFDGHHTVFARVTSGLETVNAVAAGAKSKEGRPLAPVQIVSTTVSVRKA